jgi:hypothetical protein
MSLVVDTPQIIEGTWEEVTTQRGKTLTGHRVRVTVLPDEADMSKHPDAATLALFDQWDKEDAELTPEELEKDRLIYAEIEKNGIPRTRI